MKLELKNIALTVFGPTLEQMDRGSAQYMLVCEKDTRLRGSEELDLWQFEEIKKAGEAFWRACCERIQKMELEKELLCR